MTARNAPRGVARNSCAALRLHGLGLAVTAALAAAGCSRVRSRIADSGRPYRDRRHVGGRLPRVGRSALISFRTGFRYEREGHPMRAAALRLPRGARVVAALRNRAAGWRPRSTSLPHAPRSAHDLRLGQPLIGHNVLRASTFVFPLTLLTALLAGFRPRWLATAALVGSLAATSAPYVSMIPVRTADSLAHASFWRPMLAFLATHEARGFRLEVVPTSNHLEAYYFPRAGYALARGWYRQLDIADNPVLYRPRLTPLAYRSWLRREAVRYVVLPRGTIAGRVSPASTSFACTTRRTGSPSPRRSASSPRQAG
jgi:hypothetical protein